MPKQEYADTTLAGLAGFIKGASAELKRREEAKIQQDAAGNKLLMQLLPQLFMQKRFEEEQTGEWRRWTGTQQLEREKFGYMQEQDYIERLLSDRDFYAKEVARRQELDIMERDLGISEQAEARAGAAQMFEQRTKWPKQVELEESKIEASLEQIKVDLARITSTENIAKMDRDTQMGLAKLRNDLELTLAGYQNVRAESTRKSAESQAVLDGLMRQLSDVQDRIWAWQIDLNEDPKSAIAARGLQEAYMSKQALIDNINYVRSQLGQPPYEEPKGKVEETKEWWQRKPRYIPSLQEPTTAAPAATLQSAMQKANWTQEVVDEIKAYDDDRKAKFWSTAYQRLKKVGLSEEEIAELEKAVGIQ